MFNIVLVEPEIPPNTGNIARLCLATGSTLHLVKPLGFSLENRQLKRAGLDYWDEVDVQIWDSFTQFRVNQRPDARCFFLTTKTTCPYYDASFRAGDFLVFGRENWKGSSFAAFRNYRPQWHDATWWRRHHDRIVIVIINNFPSFFFFDAGFWFPAWGYNPYSIYPYDGPVYAYDDLPPDQVIANVQAALADQGYYDGPIDDVLGPLTRTAIALYQQDHGLYVTSAV